MIFIILLLTLVRDPMVASLRPLFLPGPAPEGEGPTPASGQPSCKRRRIVPCLVDRVGCAHTCVQPDSVEIPTSVCTQAVQHRQLWAQSQGVAVHCMFILTTLDACDLCQLWHMCAVSTWHVSVRATRC